AAVVSAGEQKTYIALGLKTISRRSQIDTRRFVRRGANSGCMASGTIDAYTIHTDLLLGESDRQFLSHLPGRAQRDVTARSRQFVGEDARENHPDPVRNPRGRFHSDRAVLEMLHRIGI